VRLSELTPPNEATLSGELDGPLGSSRGSGRVRLSAEAGGTRVAYDYEVTVTGKVAAVGGRMIEAASRVVVEQFFRRLAARVGGGVAPAPWWRRLLRRLGLGR
jgi:2-furoyl-CoA dehydrogenase large subunit